MKREVVRGIADPNFLYVRSDGTFLVSDDFTDNIHVADTTGAVRVKIWRIEPASGELTLIAEGMPNIASLVFGEGRFDPTALYVTSTFRGG